MKTCENTVPGTVLYQVLYQGTWYRTDTGTSHVVIHNEVEVCADDLLDLDVIYFTIR